MNTICCFIVTTSIIMWMIDGIRYYALNEKEVLFGFSYSNSWFYIMFIPSVIILFIQIITIKWIIVICTARWMYKKMNKEAVGK